MVIQESVAYRTRREYNPNDIPSILQNADNGNYQALFDFVEELNSDDRAQPNISARIYRAINSIGTRVFFEHEDEAVLAAINKDWWLMCKEYDLSKVLTQGLIGGFGLAQKEYFEANGRQCYALKPFSSRNLRREKQDYYILDSTNKKRYIDKSVWCQYTPYGPKDFHNYALWRALALPFLVKRDNIRNWARSNAKKDAIVSTLPEGKLADDPDVSVFGNSLYALGKRGVLILPSGWSIDMLKSGGENYQTFQAAIDAADKAITIVIDNQTFTTEVPTTARTGAGVAAGRQSEQDSKDVEDLSTFIHEFLQEWTVTNFGEGVESPWLRQPKPSKTLQELLSTLESLSRSLPALLAAEPGIDVKAILKEHGVPLKVSLI